MKNPDNILLMSTDRIARSLQRMAHEINEKNKSDWPIVLLGINQRGLAVARDLAHFLTPILDSPVKVESLTLGEEGASRKKWDKSAYEKQSFIVIVDDVIFSGQTMFRALTTVVEELEPGEVYTAVLVDRGHRKYPVKAEFCGMVLPTKLDEHVAVEVKDGKVHEVRLTHEQ
ncbi:phosphoribosyltransferase family protein [Fodinibius sediminis]|uniref:Pyrimidine operon attenuation protein / uracil phosphoribosyltransferase n=1 Tax=Fodinibius sediminis TaxID=1214077 RepID=A0A521D5U1_9BACT|nr:phosphoribosyltransferase family protein [Fodinibius sediminis]SMO66461.1 pyrimidine operon attenuation protein / uracil phosphoribosyltransferase [Fodinibius sediminis]